MTNSELNLASQPGGPRVASIQTRRPIDRRTLIRGVGAAAVGLPLLEAMGPTLGQRVLGQRSVIAGRASAAEQDGAAEAPPRRFLAACATLGFHGPNLFPADRAGDHTATPYMRKLAEHHDRITLLSGLSHPDQQGNNGHASELTWLTSARRPGLAGFRNSISIDQVIAQKIGDRTRFPFLALSTRGRSMSWTAGGVEIPALSSPAKLFENLFVDGDAKQVAAEMRLVRRGRSILDTIGRRGDQLSRQVGRQDRHKVDEYMAAVRDLERRLQQSESWVRRAKPSVDREPPQDVANKNDAITKQRLLYDLIVLALQTDSTRTITFQLSGMNAVPVVPGVQTDWHGLSHHGKDPEKIRELQRIEEAEFAEFNVFLGKLRAIREGDRPLLDSTTVLFGSNLGNASAHDWHNLPILVAGGGYRHGGYAAHDPKSNTPLANVFLEIAQQMGVDVDRFGTSTAAGVRGLVS